MHLCRSRWERVVRCRGREHEKVEIAAAHTRAGQRPLGCAKGEIRRQLARSGDAALANSGSLANPFVGSIEATGKLVIGDDALGEIGAAADDLGSQAHRDAFIAEARELYPDLVQKAVHLHVDSDADRVGEAKSVGRAVAFDRDPVQTQEYSAVVAARIAAHPEFPECAARKQISDTRRERVTEGRLEKLAEQLDCSLRRLDGDVARKPVGDDDIDGPGRDIVAFDEPVEMDWCDRTAQSSARATDGVVSF